MQEKSSLKHYKSVTATENANFFAAQKRDQDKIQKEKEDMLCFSHFTVCFLYTVLIGIQFPSHPP